MLSPLNDDAIQPATLDDTGSEASRRSRHCRKTSGQSMVEFALILPVLLLIFALAADFGRAFTAYIAISSAAREGAAYGMLSSTNAADTAGIQAAALADAPSIWGTAPSVVPSLDTDTQGYGRVNVTVNYTFNTILPIPPIPSSVTLTRTVRMRVLN